jgi:hypothetical protein
MWAPCTWRQKDTTHVQPPDYGGVLVVGRWDNDLLPTICSHMQHMVSWRISRSNASQAERGQGLAWCELRIKVEDGLLHVVCNASILLVYLCASAPTPQKPAGCLIKHEANFNHNVH